MEADTGQAFRTTTRGAAPGGELLADEFGIGGLLEIFGVSTSELEIRVHGLADHTEFGRGEFVVTVVNRRMLISRTYLGGRRGTWIRDFLDDARAGLFGKVIGASSRTQSSTSA